ncbi:aminomethyl-transferring glycine dehydrogenase subunit GcvPA [Sulfobacillus harzensis]|uniref:Probable glycine dehydrogenase (decarboxylating) subunit 1 n=1 Tax=Sulfobacillus harzensis TaxID=2729629 RepID=A0A7Y0Q0L6_9FIRM|nr:aminomethyl-transferring glycine dehydrogenase subunit GcvPA [Sulfobacillus harzensis]
MRYIPHTPDEYQAMLDALNISSVDELFEDIPEQARLKRPLDLPKALSEMELSQHLSRLAGENLNVNEVPSFLGGGYYDRYIPAAVGALASRGEFVTSYTPYQAELSQGTLAAIFEFQSMIQSLTGTYAAQASMYDGASAVGEAALLALGQGRGRTEVAALKGLHPDSLQVVKTYVQARGAKLVVADSLEDLEAQVGPQTAAVLIQYPDMLGQVTLAPRAIERAHQVGALAVAACDPVALALLTPPGEMGADIVVGEGQPLGNHLTYGGPTFGYFAVQKPFVRKIPGRLVGVAKDVEGRRGFVLTLQAREQHIRREKATSNICSNHSLNALMATIYMALVGSSGLREVALRSAQMAHYLEERLRSLGLERAPSPSAPFLYEFAIHVPGDVDDLNRHLLDKKILGGFHLGRFDQSWRGLWQLAVSERRTKADCDRLVEEVAQWMSR